MLLRSSSTPVLGSLLSSFSESPSHHNSEPPPHTTTIKHPPTTIHQNHKKLSFHHQAGPLNHYTFSCNSSPISPAIAESSVGSRRSENGFRRAQSEGNLEGLDNPSCNPDEFSISNLPKKFPRKTHSSMLETIPSFSFHHERNWYEEDSDEEDDDDKEEEEREQSKEHNGFFENSIATRGSGLNFEKQNMGEYNGGGGGGDFIPVAFGRDDGDGNGPGVEQHYKKLVEDNPGNPLFLRNYAQFLYKSKGDLPRTEEYYSRAILADSKDGEVLSQYAKLVWELYHDQGRALSYFERAVQAAPEDSHVQAAYANFLWETEEDKDEDNAPNDLSALPSHFYNRTVASTTA
ncbi:hypothetical protein LOK49_LG15G00698 [Camellia lanceoleosa]|uniref:Uncharacterized protein n=1 Tax=Camellia lanceoleosa TaxID=1840588 RepID=A0ACC0F6H1_9ERIC|nr:hypothetical protein LOK49_LG15G00698 [Camellia lanceoleosa]